MIPPFCKLKLIYFYFIFCKFYVAARGFEKEPFLSYENKPQHQFSNYLYYTPVGALRCKHLRIANVERQTPPNHLYGTSHMSSVEPVSRKRIRSVGAASSVHCRNAKRVHVGG